MFFIFLLTKVNKNWDIHLYNIYISFCNDIFDLRLMSKSKTERYIYIYWNILEYCHTDMANYDCPNRWRYIYIIEFLWYYILHHIIIFSNVSQDLFRRFWQLVTHGTGIWFFLSLICYLSTIYFKFNFESSSSSKTLYEWLEVIPSDLRPILVLIGSCKFFCSYF